MIDAAPHFKSPFRIDGDSAATVEQGSDDDIVQNCVTVLRTPYGSREHDPNFGFLPQLFQQVQAGGKLAAHDIETALIRDEPRASVLSEETLEEFTSVIEEVKILSTEGNVG
jgi:phage baseplate assembly protein W